VCKEEEEIDGGGGGREAGDQQPSDNNSGPPMRPNVNIDTRQLADGGRSVLPPPPVSSGESFFAAGGAGARLERPVRQAAGGDPSPVYANASRIDGNKYHPAYIPSSAEERVRARPPDQGEPSRSQLTNVRCAL